MFIFRGALIAESNICSLDELPKVFAHVLLVNNLVAAVAKDKQKIHKRSSKVYICSLADFGCESTFGSSLFHPFYRWRVKGEL